MEGKAVEESKRKVHFVPALNEKDVDNDVYRFVRIEFILLHDGDRQQRARRIFRYSQDYGFLS